MQFQGRYHFAAPRREVWQALNNAALLQSCIPGCEQLEWVSDDALALAIRVNLGVVKPVFHGELHLSNVTAAEHYTLTGRGKGGVLGLAHGSADISLADAPRGTELRFVAEGGASGRIMQFGASLIGDRAQKVIDSFFACFGEAMGVEVATLTP